MGLNRVAVGDDCRTMTQGSSCVATLGFGTESRWDSRTERDSASCSRFAKPAVAQSLRHSYICSVTSVWLNTCQPAARIASVFVGDGINRDAPALGERRPQLFFRDATIIGRADGRKRE